MSVPHKAIFVFGSNRQGRHGAGAALFAFNNLGAICGVPMGPQGSSYAIMTKELRTHNPPVTLSEIRRQVDVFNDYVLASPHLDFVITPIGCGLANFHASEIRPLFDKISELPRVLFSRTWADHTT